MHRGYIKLWRRTLESPIFDNAEFLRFWIWCLLKASHKEIKVSPGNHLGEIIIKPGQFVFGRDATARQLGIGTQKVRTFLKNLKNMKNLTIKTTNKYSIITITNWDSYQCEDDEANQQNNQYLTSNQPATNQQLTTNKNDKNDKNDKNISSLDILCSGTPEPSPPYSEIIIYLNTITHHNYPTDPTRSKTTRRFIKARWNEGFRLEDFKAVIDNRAERWMNNPNMVEYLRPSTLFGPKFSEYLSDNGQKPVSSDDIKMAKLILEHDGEEVCREYCQKTKIKFEDL